MADTYFVLFKRPGVRRPERRTVQTNEEAVARQVIMGEHPGAKIVRAEKNGYTYSASNDPPLFPSGRASVHRVWHALERRFIGAGAKHPNDWQTQREPTGRRPKSWWGLMQALESYVKRHGKDGLQLLTCDDDAFMSSDLLLVPHESDDQWMGVTMVLCEQTKAPREFFLYPGHVDALVTALQGCQQRARRKQALTQLRELWSDYERACDRDRPLHLSRFEAVLTTYSELDVLPGEDLRPWYARAEKAEPHAAKK